MPSSKTRSRKPTNQDIPGGTDIKTPQYLLKAGGELVRTDGHEGMNEEEEDEAALSEDNFEARPMDDSTTTDSSTQPHRNKRKQTFERKNIKRVREDALSIEAQSAQRAEMERRRRLQDKEPAPASNSSATTTSENDVRSLPEEEPQFAENIAPSVCSSSEVNMRDSTYPEQLTPAPPCPSSAVPAASANLFKSYSRGYQYQSRNIGGESQDTAIRLDDSDDDVEIQKVSGPVIELSDSEDAEVTEDNEEIQEEFCELRDAANLPDAEGRICINSSSVSSASATTAVAPAADNSNEVEPIYLSPHITRIIKPHQVSGVRFLYDNLVENQKQFEGTAGFGCILAHSMGLGKSIQIIAFLDVIFRYCNARTVLLIVPINTIQNWQSEFELWLPSVWDDLQAKQTNLSSFPVGVSQSAPSLIALADTVKIEATLNIDSKEPELMLSSSAMASATDGLKAEEQAAEDTANTKRVDCGNDEVGDFEDKKDLVDATNSSLLHRMRPFKLHVIKDTTKSLDARHQVIEEWQRLGGVLLLGYEMFRLLTNPRKPPIAASLTNMASFGDRSRIGGCAVGNRKKKRAITIDIENEERRANMWSALRTALVEPGPQIVICDEGHRIKNSEANISKALKAIRTRRRVVLTGYPLQNNLMEYWCMVDFVRPSYLGTKHEFTNMFQRPIENGQCVDSTPEDRKVMQGRAHVLHDLLAGFVQRRSHAVLKASLPPKTEVVLLVKMSPLQRRLYSTLMELIGAGGTLGLTQSNTLRTYALCCKIWNHPDILWRVVEENIELVDFDLEETLPGSNNGTSCNIGRSATSSGSRNLPKRRSSTTLPWTASSPSLFSAAPSTNSLPTLPHQQQPQPFPFPNAFQPSALSFANFNGGGFPNPLFPHYMFSPQAIQQQTPPPSSDDKYSWATDPELWGRNFRPGNIENSGKMVLFLSLLENSVESGDKMLVFSQSLLTLDLIERVLGKLSLPQICQEEDEARINAQKAAAQLAAATSAGSALSSEVALSSFSPQNVIPRVELNAESLEQKTRDDSASRTTDTPYSALEASILLANLPDGLDLSEETMRSVHYRWSRRLRSGVFERPKVWTRNTHYLRLDGSTTPSERERLINMFNDSTSSAKLFLVSTRAGSLGVNLVGANRVVVFDASWNPCHDCQAVCRIYRYGQVKPCFIYRLVSDNTMERKIYDRQVTKQGVSDRVVDELNPGQQFTKAQVEVLISYEDKELPSMTGDDLNSVKDLLNEDKVLAVTLEKHKSWVTKAPFTHESLLIDRKDYRLTRVEKKIARQRYEQEKLMSASFQQAHQQQLLQLRMLQQQQHEAMLAAGIHSGLHGYPHMSNVPNILSKSGSGITLSESYRTMEAERLSRLRTLQKEFDEARMRTVSKELGLPFVNGTLGGDCKITRVVATSDLIFPSTTSPQGSERKIPKGEIVEIIQTNRGKYLRLPRTGDLYAVKAGQPAPEDEVAVNTSSEKPQDTSEETSTAGLNVQRSVDSDQDLQSQVDLETDKSASFLKTLPVGRGGDSSQPDWLKTSPSSVGTAPVKTEKPIFPPVGSGFFGPSEISQQQPLPLAAVAKQPLTVETSPFHAVTSLRTPPGFYPPQGIKSPGDGSTQSFPLCPRCRHPPPCLCGSLKASGWNCTLGTTSTASATPTSSGDNCSIFSPTTTTAVTPHSHLFGSSNYRESNTVGTDNSNNSGPFTSLSNPIYQNRSFSGYTNGRVFSPGQPPGFPEIKSPVDYHAAVSSGNQTTPSTFIQQGETRSPDPYSHLHYTREYHSNQRGFSTVSNTNSSQLPQSQQEQVSSTRYISPSVNNNFSSDCQSSGSEYQFRNACL